MATLLNPDAPLFIPSTISSPYSDELFSLYSPSHHSPQLLSLNFISKNAIFIHPSLVYLQPPHLSLIPNFSLYFPSPKLSLPNSIQSENTEHNRVFVEEKQSFSEEQNMRTVSSIRGLRGRCGNRQINKRSSKLWVRKSSDEHLSSPQIKDVILTLPDEFQISDGGKSTVMIKNIPNKLSRKQMLDLLDQHCLAENQKIKEQGLDVALSEFDFLYLPMDFISGNNLGYAFVNFTSTEAAKRLYQNMHMMTWNSFGSRKTCEISHAKIQGLEELVKHFKRSIFTCSSTDYLPVCFNPSRDGSRDCTEQLVGKLVNRSC